MCSLVFNLYEVLECLDVHFYIVSIWAVVHNIFPSDDLLVTVNLTGGLLLISWWPTRQCLGRHGCRRWRWWFKAVASRHGGKQPASQGDSPINLHTRSRTQYRTVNCQSLFTRNALYPTGWTLDTWFRFSGLICTEVCTTKLKGAVECSEAHQNVAQCNALSYVIFVKFFTQP